MVGVPLIVKLVVVSVTRFPLVGKVTFVDAVVVRVNGKLPLVVNAFAVVRFPPNVMVSVPLFTPVPPKAGLTGALRLIVPVPVIVPPVKPVPAVTLET